MKIHPIIKALMQSLTQSQKDEIWATPLEYVNYDIHTPGTWAYVTIHCSNTSFHNASVVLTAKDSRAILNELQIQERLATRS